MEANTINQACIFTVFIINGLLIGFIFDIFRILRKSFKTSDLITYIEDILFWILTGIVLLYSIFVFNNGNIRLYLFIAIVIGILTYMLLISKIVVNTSVRIIKITRHIMQKSIHIISLPFKFIYKVLKRTIFRPISFIFINLRKFTSKKIYLCDKLIKNASIFRKKEGKQVKM